MRPTLALTLKKRGYMKWLSLVIYSGLSIFSIHVEAASFDCGKAASVVEKLICSNEELSKLDENLSKAYKHEVEQSDSKHKAIEDQRQWIKEERNSCQDADCLKSAYQKRIDKIAIATAQEDYLIGRWSGAGRAAESIFGVIEITKNDISWGGCETQYSITQISVGENYPDDFLHNNRVPNGRRYVTFILKLGPKGCQAGNSKRVFLQFSISIDSPTFAVVFELNKDSKQRSHLSFTKV
jgi:uncharacterized protein